MACTWKLRAVLADRCGITSATALKARLEVTAGVKLSLQSVAILFNRSPNAIRFQTMQALCDATGLQLSDFCEVVPDAPVVCKPAKPLYRSRRSGNELTKGFPSPRAFYGSKPFEGYRHK